MDTDDPHDDCTHWAGVKLAHPNGDLTPEGERIAERIKENLNDEDSQNCSSQVNQ